MFIALWLTGARLKSFRHELLNKHLIAVTVLPSKPSFWPEINQIVH